MTYRTTLEDKGLEDINLVFADTVSQFAIFGDLICRCPVAKYLTQLEQFFF
jgi:hypothetical protein